MAAALSRTADAQVLLVDYRLAPEHPYPAAVDDALTAYRWLSPQVGARSVVVAGDSAGAGLSIALLLALRNRGEPLPAGGITVSGWFDLTLASDSVTALAPIDPIISAKMLRTMAVAYLQSAPATTPDASPLFGDLSGLPPLLVLSGLWDSLVGDSSRFVERAREHGVDVTASVAAEMYHTCTWHLMSSILPEARRSLDEMGTFVRRVTDVTRAPRTSAGWRG